MNLQENGPRFGGKLFFGLEMQIMMMRNTTKNYLDTPEESKAKRLSQR